MRRLYDCLRGLIHPHSYSWLKLTSLIPFVFPVFTSVLSYPAYVPLSVSLLAYFFNFLLFRVDIFLLSPCKACHKSDVIVLFADILGQTLKPDMMS